MRWIGLFSVLWVIAIATDCAGGPTTPSTGGTTIPSARGKLQIDAMRVSDVVQGTLGDWQYKVTAQLREIGGVDVTVTDIQVQALLRSTSLATTSVVPMLSVSAYSSKDAGVVFAAATQIDLSAVTVAMTIQFTDANENTGSVNNSFSCFGCWDY
jgi:hypothetical protein